MADRERCWTPLRRLVSVLVLVTVTVVSRAARLDTRVQEPPPVHLVATPAALDNASSSGAPAPSTFSSVAPTTDNSESPCPDPHANRSSSCADCQVNYCNSGDPDRNENNTCRVKSGGYLRQSCKDVSDCNCVIHHVICDGTCQCRTPYVPFDESTCFDNSMGWRVAIKTAGITVLVLALGFFIAFGIKGCSRSVRDRLSRQVPWLRRTSDISFHSGDFFVGSLSQAILDRPPSYCEEDTDKPPAYEEVFPEQDGVVNAGFSPDSAPESPGQQQQQQPATVEPESAPPPRSGLPAVPAVHRPAGRGHRRGLSGPAAIHLGAAGRSEQPGGASDHTAETEQTGHTAELEQTSHRTDPEQTRQRTDSEQTSHRTDPEQTRQRADPEQTRQRTDPEQTSHRTDPEQTSHRTDPEQTSHRTDPEQTSHRTDSGQTSHRTDLRQTSNTSDPGQTTPTAGLEQTKGANPEEITQTTKASWVSQPVGMNSDQVAAETPSLPTVAMVGRIGDQNSPPSPGRSGAQGAVARVWVQSVDDGARDTSIQPEEVWEDIKL